MGCVSLEILGEVENSGLREEDRTKEEFEARKARKDAEGMAGFDYGPGLLRVRASMVRRYAVRDGTEE